MEQRPDTLRVKPSPRFRTVLEELWSLPGAPRALRTYFRGHQSPDERAESPKPEPRGDVLLPAEGLTKRRNAQTPREETQQDGEHANQKAGKSGTEEKRTRDDEEGSSTDEEAASSELLLTSSDVRWVHLRMRERGVSDRISALLNESVLVVPAYSPPKRSEELEARVQRLRREQEEREYAAMTRSVRVGPKGGSSSDVTSVGRELQLLHQEMNGQLITGMQYIVSIVGTFFALFIGLRLATDDWPVRAVGGVVGAVAVGVAELYFIVRSDLSLKGTVVKGKERKG